jgi:thioredoxin 1
VIPTQIFFDSEGIEVWRHEGFLPREDIVAKLREMGVEEP